MADYASGRYASLFMRGFDAVHVPAKSLPAAYRGLRQRNG